MGKYNDLIAYQKAYSLAMDIFHVSKKFPAAEMYSMTDQIRRCSRSVCTNIVEAYRRRRYKKYFITKMNDAETENAETEVWLDFAADCKYIHSEEYLKLKNLNSEIGKLIYFMISNPEKFS